MIKKIKIYNKFKKVINKKFFKLNTTLNNIHTFYSNWVSKSSIYLPRYSSFKTVAKEKSIKKKLYKLKNLLKNYY